MNDSELIEETRRVNHDLACNALGERVPILDMLADRLQQIAEQKRIAHVRSQIAHKQEDGESDGRQ